jgi:hypothetical protein
MKNFNVAILSTDPHYNSHFFSVKAMDEDEAIQLAQGTCKNILIDLGWDPVSIDMKMTEQKTIVFELHEI